MSSMSWSLVASLFFFFFQAEDGIRDLIVTGVQTCALPISHRERVRLLEDHRHPAPQRGRLEQADVDAVERYPARRRRAPGQLGEPVHREIGRASCRERV